jgi:hypothetical protein
MCFTEHYRAADAVGQPAVINQSEKIMMTVFVLC